MTMTGLEPVSGLHEKDGEYFRRLRVRERRHDSTKRRIKVRNWFTWSQALREFTLALQV